MALSGSFYTNVESHWRLSISWTATQDISANQSTITAKMYWESLDQYGAVYSSATKTSGIQHDDGSWSTESKAGMAGLDANEKKLINTYSFVLTHDPDGTKSFSLDGYFDAEVKLNGTMYNTINLTQTSFTLNTIPRESSITSSCSWTAGNTLPVSISRHSSSFTHDVKVYVNGNWIKTVTGVGTSTTISFSASENADIMGELRKDTSNWNQSTYLILVTKNGSSTIGTSSTTDFTGTCTMPTASIPSGSDFTIGNNTTINITSEKNSAFVYDLVASYSGYSKKLLSKSSSSSATWATGSTDDGGVDTLYSQMPTINQATVTYTLTTYWNNSGSYTQIRNSTTDTAKANIDTKAQSPTFTASGTTYKDSDSNISGKTGSDQYIVQGKSTLAVTLPTGGLASAKTGTSITKYQCVFGGKTKTNTTSLTSAQTFTFTASELSAVSSNQNAVLTAIDARGNSTSVSIAIKVVPYSLPKITATALRDDGFSDPVTLTLTGTISPVNVNGVNKNAIVSMKYEYKLSSATTYPTSGNGFLTSFTPATATYPAYKAVNVNLATQMISTSSWNVHFVVTDTFGSNYDIKTVTTGKPIFFIDSNNKSMGFNDFPQNANEFRMNGRVVFGSNMYGSTTGGEGSGAIYMNNSDITGANAIWFNDYSQGRGEGLLFPKTTTTNGSTTTTDYDNFYIKDGQIYINDGTGEAGWANDLDLNNHNIWGVNGFYFNDTATGNEGINFPKPGTVADSRVNADYDAFRIYDGTAYLNDKPMFTSDSTTLWTSSGVFMNGSQTYTISKSLSSCPNGWVLVWSRYSSGGQPDNWNFNFIPKEMLDISVNGINLPVGTSASNTSLCYKYIYVTDTTIKGHDMNSTAPANTVCLRYVLSY